VDKIRGVGGASGKPNSEVVVADEHAGSGAGCAKAVGAEAEVALGVDAAQAELAAVGLRAVLRVERSHSTCNVQLRGFVGQVGNLRTVQLVGKHHGRAGQQLIEVEERHTEERGRADRIHCGVERGVVVGGVHASGRGGPTAVSG